MNAGRSVLCYIHGEDQQWEAICVDLDISVEAASEHEARATLRDAIHSYFDAAMEEDPADRDRLLSRRAPLHVRLGLWLRMLAFTLSRRGGREEAQGVFGVPCPA